MLRKILGWLVLALALMWLVKNPAAAAALIRHIGHALAILTRAL